MDNMIPDNTTQVTYYPNLYEWVGTLESKVDNIITSYFTTNYDQSTVFFGKLFSFAYTLAHYGDTPYVCAEKVKEDLSQLLERYFKRNDVSVTYEDVVGSENRYVLKIELGVSDGTNDSYENKLQIETDGSTYAKVMSTLNSQTELDVINKKRQERAYEY